MLLSHWRPVEILKVGLILIGAIAVMWLFMIRPHTFDWQPAGEVNGTVRTLMSNSKVIGRPVINAVIDLENGGQTILAVPIKSDVRAGDRLVLRVYADAENNKRKQYEYLSEVP